MSKKNVGCLTESELRKIIECHGVFLEKKIINDEWQATGNIGIRSMQGKSADFFRQHKRELLDIMLEDELKEQEKIAKRAEAIDAIEGLAEIKHAIEEIAYWHYRLNKSFADGFGGIGVGPKPNYDVDAMRAKYPRADAYLKAEEMTHKINYELSAIGETALEEVIFGDYEKAMKQMESDISEFVKRHVFD